MKGRCIDERWLKGMGVASPDACAECSGDCPLRPMRISSQRPENSRLHLKPLFALLGACSFPAPGVMRTPGKLRGSRARELIDEDSEAVLFFSETGSSSMTKGTSPDGEGTLLGS